MTTHTIDNIRNFAIIAHIDHGKSTLADRLIQQTGTVAARDMVEQVLDSMDIERERGITIKAQTVRLEYAAKDGRIYVLNLMDTPGHVDFAYEVSRSLAACEGSLLVVDASQGVEAQTLANVYHALDAGHEIVPVLNKVDLPAAEPDRIKQQIEDVIGLDASDAVPISAKTGLNVDLVLEAIVTRLPPPKGDEAAPLKALLVDSWYDAYLGVVVLVRVVDGVIRKGGRIRMMGADAHYEVDRIGIFRPKMTDAPELGPGEIGYITAQIKQVADTRVGDTITDDKRPTAAALPGFKPAQPVVFCGLFPVDAANFEDLRAAVGRLRLNDASFSYEMETSAALGFGFRCGFLGLLHLEIIQERLEREFNLDLIATAPSVIYRIALTDRSVIELHNPADMPDVVKIQEIQEPWIKATILTPDDYLGAVLKLCQDRRGAQVDLNYVGKRAMVVYDLPLNEVVFDFYDRLKSISKGYASFDYTLTDYRAGDLVKMSILVNGEPVDALSMLVHRDRAEARGRAMVEKLRELIPPHMFQIPIQAAIGGKIIARETIRALRKDVTAKCYGGDATRKRKLLEKQKAGKKKMRQFGKVDIPQEAFIAALKMDGWRAPPGFAARVLDVNGYRFDAIISGDESAPLVLFLHGWPSFAASWREVMAPVAAAGFRAAAVDQRGYSRGARPGAIADYSVERLIGDIDGFARALAGDARFHLVGHDWGGLIAWSYAAHRAERLASLTVLSTPHSAAFLEAMRSDPRQSVMSAYIGVFRQPGHVAEQALLRDGARKLRALYGGKLSAEAVEENIARLGEPGALTATLNWYRALDNKWLGSSVTTPTLYIWGTDDQALGAVAAKATGRHVTGPYQFEILEGASHWLPEETPATVVRLLLAHLANFPAQ